MKRINSAILCLFVLVGVMDAQNESFEKYRAKQIQRFNAYNEKRHLEFEEFRRKRNEKFAEFVRSRWALFETVKGTPKPKEQEVPPILFDKDKLIPPTPNPLPFDEIVKINIPTPQPLPIEPIEEIPIGKPIKDGAKEPVWKEEPSLRFEFFGTPLQVRLDKSKQFRLKKISENAIADAWLELSEPIYTNLIYDCLNIRKTHSLCDWAYLEMLHAMADAACGEGTNESTLLMAYVYCQSGYKMRLARTNKRLYMIPVG